ncbi:MAG: diguanylate cyclase [Gammaproteobacteria bacterium]|nr:diguanylate cyclase [Gammaproteobacteria bacterium]
MAGTDNWKFSRSALPRSLADLPAGEAAIALGYCLAALAVGRFTHRVSGVALLGPADAIAAAALLRLPRPNWPRALALIFAAAGLADALCGAPGIPAALGGAVTRTLDVALMAGSVRLIGRYEFPRVSLTQASIATILFGVLAPGLAAVAGSAVDRLVGPGAPFAEDLRLGWSSASLGACLFSAPILLSSRAAWQRLLRPRYLAVNLLLLSSYVLGVYLAMRFVALPFVLIGMGLMIAAYPLGGFGTSLLSAACGITMIALWTAGIRPTSLLAVPSVTSLAGFPVIGLFTALLPPIAVGIGTDERRAIARALRASERRFRDSIEHSPIGMLIVDLDGLWTYANAALQRMLGYTEEELRAMPFGGPSDPQDRGDSVDRRRRLLNGEYTSYEVERRFRHKDGHWVWTHSAVSLVRDEDGGPRHLVVQIESIEDRRRAEAKFAEERQRLKVTLSKIADAVVTTDPQTRITYLNDSAAALMGLDADYAVNRRLDEVIHLTDAATGRRAPNLLARCLIHGRTCQREVPALLHRPDGSVMHIVDVISPVIDADGVVAGTVILFRDASRDVERSKDLHFRATHDPLTGLANRTLFNERLRETFAQSAHLSTPAVLIAIDLDRFKAVNDSGGHAAGDALLRRVADLLRAHVRAADTVARLGGDEFAVILPNCPMEVAETIARDLARELNPLAADWDGVAYEIGASLGVASRRDDMRSVDDWLATADEACYIAKRDGRGRVSMAGPTIYAEGAQRTLAAAIAATHR